MPVLRDDFRELLDVPPVWLRPTVIVEVEYRQCLRDGLRHAALKGIQPNKRPRLIGQSLGVNCRRSGQSTITWPPIWAGWSWQ